jgi:hypothetical protein
MSAPHWGTFRRWPSLLSPPVDTRRYLSIPTGSSGSTGRHGSTGLEDEDEDEDEDEMLYRELVVALAAVLTVRSQ